MQLGEWLLTFQKDHGTMVLTLEDKGIKGY